MPQHKRPMIAHYGCFEDVSAVINTCPLCGVSCATFWCFEVDCLFSGQSMPWDQRVTACPSFHNQKIAVMH